MKHIKILITNVITLVVCVGQLLAQEVVVPDSTGVAKSTTETLNSITKKDTVKAPFKRYKAEGVTAVVGDYVVLDTDIDKGYIELQSQGISIENVSRCQLLGKLLEDKLYAHHAKQDSIVVSDAEINAQIDQQLDYMISELGDADKVAKYYRKNNIAELKSELFEVNKTIKLASEMQRKVVEDVEITPEETREFFFSIPEDERPIFSAEVEVAQIVIEPEVTKEARDAVIERLREIRADIVDNGASFATKAVLYSKDGTAQKGGLIEGVTRTSPLAKEFKDKAFSLLEGEVSEPFETEFGFHILYIDKVRGQEVDVRHIILFPEVTQITIDKAKDEIEAIREKIVNGEVTFAEAARNSSDEKETRNNGGQLVNPVTGDTRFDLTKMDPALSAYVYNLKKGEVSKVYSDRDYTGKSSFKILTLTNRYEEHRADYSKDYEKIKELALKEKQIEAIKEWQDKKVKETYINVNEDYHDCEFSSNWLNQ
ncbi:peptidylprolyl isomerase [Patiriisocius hiemis]|uniref:Peptidylprolyl isomerase n=1 Tax=Patiriisocius hiemis TaxID=3075604 RepID=A0ABU2Y949_9FLAO|nr:peptidylprolyl isomerase [Constantimarinum sp. W242]MDT0554706.1 peptidylprolyl isomerase [Constantimarinum sp. W242]